MKNVAVIGASSNRSKFGNKAVRAYLRKGFQVFPVHPAEERIEGLDCYTSLSAIPVELETVSVYVPPVVLLKLLPEIANKGCRELWLNPGTESSEVLSLAEELGLPVIQACSIVGLGMTPAEFDE